MRGGGVKAKKSQVYTDEFRASAVAMLAAEGYPAVKGSLQRVADLLGIHARTLSRWFNGENNPPPDMLVSEKRDELSDMFERVAYQYLDHATKPEVVASASARDAMTAAGIAVDKMRLLRGMPTAIVSLMPGFVEAIKAMGQDPEEVMKRAITRAGLGDTYLQ